MSPHRCRELPHRCGGHLIDLGGHLIDEGSYLRCRAGVSTSFEVGGWKTKVGGCDKARGQRPQDTRGVRGQAHPGNF